MGGTNWIVTYKNNQPFKFDDLESIWIKYDSKKLISKIYDEWLMIQVEAISQKIMGIN